MYRYPVLTISLVFLLAAAVAAGHEFPDPRQFEEGSREWLKAVDALKYKPLMHDSLTQNCPHSFDVLHYNISLYISIGDETISGNTVVTAVSEEAGLDSIDLDLTVLTVDKDVETGKLWSLGFMYLADLGDRYLIEGDENAIARLSSTGAEIHSITRVSRGEDVYLLWPRAPEAHILYSRVLHDLGGGTYLAAENLSY